MATNVLAVHLSATHVSVAVAESTLRSLRITAFGVAQKGASPVTELIASRRWDRVLCSVPAPLAYHRFLDFPFRDRRRLEQAVGPALEELVPLSLDEAVTAHDHVSVRPGGRVLAAMAKRSVLDAHLSNLAALGITPTQVVWEPSALLATYRHAAGTEAPCLVIDLGRDSSLIASLEASSLSGLRIVAVATAREFERDLRWAATTLEPKGDRVIVSGYHHASAIQRVTKALDGLRVEFLADTCPVAISEHAYGAWKNVSTVVGLMLIAEGDTAVPLLSFPATAKAPSVDPTEGKEIFRRLAAWAAATVLILAIALGLDYARLIRDVTRLERATGRILATAMPGVAADAGQRMKLEVKLAELEHRRDELQGAPQADGALAILVSMSQAVPHDLQVEFESYTYDPPHIRFKGNSNSFETVTRLQQVLRDSTPYKNVDVGDVRSTAGGDGVQFELSIRLGELRRST